MKLILCTNASVYPTWLYCLLFELRALGSALSPTERGSCPVCDLPLRIAYCHPLAVQPRVTVMLRTSEDVRHAYSQPAVSPPAGTRGATQRRAPRALPKLAAGVAAYAS